jgi:uncharacterized protein (UPF0548 family)
MDINSLYALLFFISMNSFASSSMTFKSLGSFPNINILRHSQRSINKFINEKQLSPFNHEYSGLSSSYSDPSLPKLFRVLKESKVVGHGIKDFQRASTSIFSFDMVNAMPWANVVFSTDTKDIKVGTVLCTLIKCYKSVWTLNPCRVCYIDRNTDDIMTKKNIDLKGNDAKIVDQIGYSTVKGHLIAGEERFRVSLMNDDSVVFEIYSFTKGAGLFGTLAMPFIRPLQAAFFKDAIISMKNLIAE